MTRVALAARVGVATLIAGAFALGRASVSPAPATPGCASAHDVDRIRSSLRRLEMAVAALATCPVAAAAEPTPPRAPVEISAPASPAAEKAADVELHPQLAAGAALLERALARGQWSDDDEHRLEDLQSQDTEASWLPLLQRISAGINDGRLRLSTAPGATPTGPS